MRAIIGARLLSTKAAQPAEKPFEIYDSRLPGFTLRVQPSGVRSFYARTGRNTRVALGRLGELTPDEARERCQKVLGNVAHRRPPLHGLDGAEGLTLAQFIEGCYRPWLEASRPKGAKRTLQRIATCFGEWYGKPLAEITVELIERWRTDRLSAGTEPSTILRDVMTLSGVLATSPEAVIRYLRLGQLF